MTKVTNHARLRFVFINTSFFFFRANYAFSFAKKVESIWNTITCLTFQRFPSVTNGGSIVMGADWNTQNTSKYITIHVYCDVFLRIPMSSHHNTATIICIPGRISLL